MGDIAGAVRPVKGPGPEASTSGPRLAEFFAGIGLVRVALEPLGWRVAFANDIDSSKQEIYGQNFGLDEFRLGDIRDLRGDEVPPVDLAWASFPCVDLSLAGWRNGLDGADSGTFWTFTRIVEEMSPRPPVVVIENVLGFATSGGGRDFAKALGRMNELGYIADILVLDAVHFVPQSRPRLFVVCTEKPITDADDWRASVLRPAWVHRFAEANPHLWLQAAPLPLPEHEPGDLAPALQRLPDDAPEWWDEEKVGHLVRQMTPEHRSRAERLADDARTRFATVYRRVRSGVTRAEVRDDGIAGCLRTPRGGSSRQIVIAGRNGRLRARFMTPREYARLMGVPDSYVVDVPVNQALWGFGDAVCVPAVRWLGENYLNGLVSAHDGSRNPRATR